MTATTTTSGSFDIGRVVQRTFATVSENLGVFLGLSTLLSGLPAALVGWTTYTLTHSMGIGLGVPHIFDQAAMPGLFGGGALAGFLSFLAGLALQAAIIYGTVAHLNGRRAGFGECLANAARHLLPLCLLAIVMGLAEIVGLMFFIFPAAMMAMAWIVAVPALVSERTGVFGALGRSADLTRRHRWAIFGLAIVYWIVYAVFRQVLATVIMTFSASTAPFGGLMLGTIVAGVIMTVAGQVIASAGVASIYYELRSTKEGIGPEALAAVFD
jgi:MFS family permease